MFEKLTELISNGEMQDALYEFQDEHFHIEEMAPCDATKLCVLEATIWETLNDGTALLGALYKGLGYDYTNYEIYYMLGLYYRNTNVNWAYLCMEMALDYCQVPEDLQVIESSFNEIKELPGLRVRNTSVMVLSYNDYDLIQLCIDSIEKYAPSASTEIVVVDNNSSDERVRSFLQGKRDGGAGLPFKLVLSDENLGFPKGCNLGVQYCEDDNDIFFLNNDAVLTPLSLFFLRMGLYDNRNVGSVSAFSNSASLQELDFGEPLWHKKMDPEDAIKVFNEFVGKRDFVFVNPYVKAFRLTAFALLVSRDALNSVMMGEQVFDEIYSPGYFEDDDLGVRLACAGFEQYVCKNSYIYHNGGGGFEGHEDAMDTARKKFIKKWNFDVWSYSLPWEAACEEVIRKAGEKKGILKVLDFDCGLGANAAYIKSRADNVFVAGVCNNAFAAGIAARIADETAFGEANTTRLPWADHSFDVVIAEKTHVSLGQIGRFLKPDGRRICEDEFPF